jgi:hypothetical protein
VSKRIVYILLSGVLLIAVGLWLYFALQFNIPVLSAHTTSYCHEMTGNGVNIYSTEGDEVDAATYGFVTNIEQQPNGLYVVEIRDLLLRIHCYYNLQSVDWIRRGGFVKCMQAIGTLGVEDEDEQPYLYYEIQRCKGSYKNPIPLFDKSFEIKTAKIIDKKL